jgi:hypothetical protein
LCGIFDNYRRAIVFHFAVIDRSIGSGRTAIAWLLTHMDTFYMIEFSPLLGHAIRQSSFRPRSRRASLYSISLCIALAAAASAQTISNPISQITVTSVMTASTQGATALSYLSAADQQALNALLPYSVAVTNNGSEPIIAIAFDWVVTSHDGNIHHHVISKVVGVTPLAKGINIGQTLLGMPVCLVGRAGQNDCQNRLKSVPQLPAELSNPLNVAVNVDGIVTSSGHFIGPNKTFLYEHLTAQLSADKTVAQTILNMHAQGASLADMIAQLGL